MADDDESLLAGIIKTFVVIFILYLIFSGVYFIITQYRNGSLSSSTNSGEDMSLAQLANLSFNDTATNSQLFHRSFWDTALAESGRTTINIGHDTIFGLIQSDKNWTALVSQGLDNPPPWLSQGLWQYTSGFITELSSRIIGTGNTVLAERVMKNLTSYVAGLSLTGADFVCYNGAGEEVPGDLQGCRRLHGGQDRPDDSGDEEQGANS